MKPALVLLLGVGASDLLALNALVVPRLLATEPATATEPEPEPEPATRTETVAKPEPAAPPLTPSERPGRESRRHEEAPPRLAAAAARSGQAEVAAPFAEPASTRPERAALYFATERATIYPAAAARLDEVAARLADDSRLTVHVTAHACAAGTNAYNLALSRRRARRVTEYLAARGIDPARITSTARGERDASAVDPDAREDRRVDLTFEVERATDDEVHP